MIEVLEVSRLGTVGQVVARIRERSPWTEVATVIYLLIAARASKISLKSQLFSFQQWGGLEAAGWTARIRITFGSAFSHAVYEHQNSGLELAIFIAVLRPEIWTPDFWPRIGHFHCRREARNMDARFLAVNRPFSLPS